MEQVRKEIITTEKIKQIRTYHKLLNVGSSISCYLMNKKFVMKLFEATCQDPESKLYLPNHLYGNNTYFFVNNLEVTPNGKIAGYTMPYIEGKTLNKRNFNELEIQKLLKFIEIIIQDTDEISKLGIYTYDNFISNIFLTDTGFKCIDPIEFQIDTRDVSQIKKDNLRIFFENFWDFLISEQVKKFGYIHGYTKETLLEDPKYYFEEIYKKIQEISDEEIITVGKVKKYTKTRSK